MLKSKLLSATAAAPETIAIEDVFSTWLYTGNSSTQTITNGIDLAGEGGLVWLKDRSFTGDNKLFDTVQGMTFASAKELASNTIGGAATRTNLIEATSSGFNLGTQSYYRNYNQTGDNYASWTFRKAPSFFDVVTWTGNNVQGRAISHNLGIVPGCIIVKITSGTTDNWVVYHRSVGAGKFLKLNATDSQLSSSAVFPTTPTDGVFYVGNDSAVNWSGGTYVAYLFAHDPLGPSGDGSDGLIACGSFTGNESTFPVIDLGWEPQWVFIKAASTTGNWQLFDNMRGIATGGEDPYLWANSSGAESSNGNNYIDLYPTGFGPSSIEPSTNSTGETFIYIAIRRGPMREPTVGTEVFSPNTIGAVSVGTPVTTNFPVDLQIATWRGGTSSHYFYDRLRGVSSRTTEGAKSLLSDSTAAETSPTTATRMWGNTGYQVDTSWSNSVSIFHNFRRAPGFFDVVAYTGDGVSGRTVSHNLGVAPELMIVKQRSSAGFYWAVYYGDNTSLLQLNESAAAITAPHWNNTSPTNEVFYLGTQGQVNRSPETYIAYLFATLPGVSKVGSYTGNGSSQTINCGFTGGARFVLIKRTDSTGDWYVWDTARGIVAGNDPHLSLNTTAAEVTTDDSIDPDSSGFIVNQLAATNINVSSASYIYLAIA